MPTRIKVFWAVVAVGAVVVAAGLFWMVCWVPYTASKQAPLEESSFEF